MNIEEKIKKLKAEITVLELLIPYANNGKIVLSIEMIKELKDKYIEVMNKNE